MFAVKHKKRKTVPLYRKDYFTTSEAGKAVGVSARTVIQWIDDKRLEGWTIPGSRDRRVSRTALVKFLRTYAIDVPEALYGPVVVYFGLPAGTPPDGYDALEVASAFDLGWRVRARHAAAVVIHADNVGTRTAHKLGQELRAVAAMRRLVGIRVAEDEARTDDWLAAGYDEVLAAGSLPGQIDAAVARLLQG